MQTTNTPLSQEDLKKELNKPNNILGIVNRRNLSEIKYIFRANPNHQDYKTITPISRYGIYDTSTNSFISESVKQEMYQITARNKRVVELTSEQKAIYLQYEKEVMDSSYLETIVPVTVADKISSLKKTHSILIYTETPNKTLDSFLFNKWKIGLCSMNKSSTEIIETGIELNYLLINQIFAEHDIFSASSFSIFKNEINNNFILGVKMPYSDEFFKNELLQNNNDVFMYNLFFKGFEEIDSSKNTIENEEGLEMKSKVFILDVISNPFIFFELDSINSKTYKNILEV